MRPLAALLALAAAGLCAFGYWGVFTAAGSAAYDEMDGMIPFFAGVAGVACALLAAVAAWLGRRRA